jgi:hypothetical protein
MAATGKTEEVTLMVQADVASGERGFSSQEDLTAS